MAAAGPSGSAAERLPLPGVLSELPRRKGIHTAIVDIALARAGVEVVTTLLPVYGGGDTGPRVVADAIPGKTPAREPVLGRMPPAPATPLVGRDDDVAALIAMLKNAARMVPRVRSRPSAVERPQPVCRSE